MAGKPYPQETREQVIAIFQSGGMKALKAPHLQPLRYQKKFPSLKTCRRYVKQFQQEGNVLPKRPTGNDYSKREIHGQDLINLALYRVIRPKAYIDELCAYIHNQNPTNPPYSRSQIHRAEERLGLSLKVASSTSELAYTPINLRKRDNYWHRQHPQGVDGEDTDDMIDIDEAAFGLQAQDRKRGKVTKERRCDARGKFKKGAGRVSLLLGISGHQRNPFSFHKQFSKGGTNQWRFYVFMREFIDWLDANRPGGSFCFTMDNLNIHKHPVILDMIEDAGHRIVFRAPYWSCDGPIEYVFNTIHFKLQMDDDGVDNTEDLIDKIDDIVFDLTGHTFTRYFRHVGFN